MNGVAETLRAARQRYFDRLGCSEPDYDAWLIRLPLEGVLVAVPNPPAHGRALRCHDLHHVLTGYGTDWIGEAELSAWELAGGCGRYVGAIGFDLSGTALGLVLAPRRTFRAFVRGRRGTNLFRYRFDARLLELSVEAARAELGVVPESAPELADRLVFGVAAFASVAFVLSGPIGWAFALLTLLAPAPSSLESARDHCLLSAARAHDIVAAMEDRFAIKISGALSLLLKIIKVNRESAFVELRDDALFIQFGYVDATIPYGNIASVEKGSWSIAFGYGLRIAPKKTMGYVSATGDVVYVALKEAQDLKAGPGDMSMSRERVAISLEEPDSFVDALKAKLAR